MIIECTNCNKKFNVNSDLIPDEGRLIKCGSCNHIWHFKRENHLKNQILNNIQNDNKDLSLSENDIEDNKSSTSFETNKLPEIIINNDDQEICENLDTSIKKEDKKINNFFSYLLVMIVSFVAFIILLDTLKLPLINFFPGLEVVLFNLFETMKDIKLFIIDLI